MVDAIRSTRPSDAIVTTAADPRRPRLSRTPAGDPNRELGARAPPGGVGRREREAEEGSIAFLTGRRRGRRRQLSRRATARGWVSRG
jgi:hypothetical protein